MNSRCRSRLFAAALVLSTAAACSAPQRYSPIPLPANHPTSLQREVQAVHHWRLMAASIALATRQMVESEPGGMTASFTLVPSQQTSDFSQAFHELLITELHNAGLRIAIPPAAGTAIRYTIQLVEFGDGRRTDYPLYATDGNLPPELAVTDASEISDWRAPRHELMVTTSIQRGDSYGLRRSDIYYLRSEDAQLYRPGSSGLAYTRLIDLVREQETRRMRAGGWPSYSLPTP